MISPAEFALRSILFVDLGFVGFVPSNSYIYDPPTFISPFLSVFLQITALIASFYAILTIITKGFVEDLTNNILDIPQQFIRMCYICENIKPERSHHCKSCKRCVKKMDHHCNILGACINFYNHGHFLRFLFFGFCAHFSILLFNIYFIFAAIKSPVQNLSYSFCTYMAIFTFVVLFVSSILGYHLYVQGTLLTENITNIEDVQRHNSRYRKISVLPSPYNQGLIRNLVSVLGPRKYLFLWRPSGDGMEFEKNYETWYWPLNESTIPNVLEVI